MKLSKIKKLFGSNQYFYQEGNRQIYIGNKAACIKTDFSVIEMTDKERGFKVNSATIPPVLIGLQFPCFDTPNMIVDVYGNTYRIYKYMNMRHELSFVAVPSKYESIFLGHKLILIGEKVTNYDRDFLIACKQIKLNESEYHIKLENIWGI